MGDIAKRLRASVRMGAHNGDAMERGVCGRQMTEAADTIERQEREIERLREALGSIASTNASKHGNVGMMLSRAVEIAVRAIDGSPARPEPSDPYEGGEP